MAPPSQSNESMAPVTTQRATSGDAFEFVRELATSLSSSNIELPSYPAVATRVQKVLAEENASSERVVRVLGAEAVLAGRVLTMANSAALNTTGAPITELRAAVGRLGFDAIRSAVISFAVTQLRRAEAYKAIERHLNVLWQHSVQIAANCYVIARRHGKVNADSALLTGLVHGVGKLYILTRSVKHPALFSDQAMYQRIIRDWHGNIAKALLESWSISDDIVAAVHSYEDDARDGRGMSGALSDILEIAEVLSTCKDSQPMLEAAMQERKAAGRLNLTAAACQALVAESAQELQALRDALGR